MLLIGLLNGQSQEVAFKNFTVEDGLPSNETYHVVQDYKGNIWIATNAGVSKYNGKEFENYTIEDGLADNTVFEIYQDCYNRLWFIPYSCKLSYYSGGKISKYRYNNIIQKMIKRPNPIKLSFATDLMDNIYLGSVFSRSFKIDRYGQFDYLDDENVSYFTLNQIGKRIVTSQNCTGSKEIIQSRRNYGENHIFTIQSRDPKSVSIVDNDGDILFSQGEYLYLIKGGEIKLVKKYSDRIIWLSIDKNNRLWISVFGDGLYLLQNWKHGFFEQLFLDEKYVVTSVLVDSFNGVWISTYSNGVLYLPVEGLKCLDKTVDNEKINDLVYFDNKLIYGGKKGKLYTYNLLNRLKSEYIPEKNKRLVINDININKDSILLSTNVGLYLYNDDNDSIYRSSIAPLGFKNNTFNAKGILFIDNEMYVAVSMRSNIMMKYKQGLIPLVKGYGTTNCIAYYNSKLIIGTPTGLKYVRLQNNKYSSCLNSFQVHDIYISDLFVDSISNTLLVSTRGRGLYYISDSLFYNWTRKEGLLDNTVNCAIPSKGNIIVGTNRGMSIVDTAGFILNYGSEYYFNSPSISRVLLIKDTLYIVTEKGINYCNLSELKKPQVEIYPYVNKISCNGYDTVYCNNFNMHDDDQYKLNIKGVELKSLNRELNLRYINKGKTLTESYLNGRYSVGIKDLNYGRTVMLYQFKPAFGQNIVVKEFMRYKKPIYKAKSFFITLIVIILIFYPSMDRIVKKKKKYNLVRKKVEKNKVARRRNDYELRLLINEQKALSSQINPHFIFNSLNSIKYYSYRNDTKSTDRYLTKYSNLIRIILENSRNSVIPLDKELSALREYVELEQMRFKSSFNFIEDIDIRSDFKHIHVPPLIFQPFIENSIKHGVSNINEGIVVFALKEQSNRLYCTIEDNGPGMLDIQKDTGSKKSLGSKITKQRISLLRRMYKTNIKIEYENKYEGANIIGYIVRFSIPFQNPLL